MFGNRHLNSAHARFNRDDGGLLPDAYLRLVRKKGQRISEHIKGPLAAVITSPPMKALDRSVHQTVSDLKFSKVLLNKFCWTRNTVIFDGKVKVETYIKIIFPIRLK